MRVDEKLNMQDVNCISIFLDQFCESIYVKRSIALSLPRQSSLVPQCKMAFNRHSRNPEWCGGDCEGGGGGYRTYSSAFKLSNFNLSESYDRI